MDKRSETKTLRIPDVACQRIGCQATWGTGNQLFVFASQQEKSDGPTGSGVHNAQIHEVRWDTELHGPVTRKLVNESQNIFLELQTFAKEEEPKSKQQRMVQFSHKYRAVIKSSVLDLQRQLKLTRSENERQICESQLQLFDMIELIWNLCEILFIDVQPGGAVIEQLLKWLHLHFVEGDEKAKAALQDDRPQDHPLYWQAVYSYVLQGRLDDARHLLTLHNSSGSNMFQSLDELLCKMPVYSRFQSQSSAEFLRNWQHWRQECVRRLEDGEFSTDDHVCIIVRILCGEDQVFQELWELCETWYCMLVSRQLYCNPTIKGIHLQNDAQFCINAYGGNSKLQTWDNILLAALEFDIHQVIKESCSSNGNWWFVSHLADLLQHCGVLEAHAMDFGANLREFLLLDYASSLFSHHSLWQVAANYLDQCGPIGRSYLEQLVERLPLETERKALKVLSMCESRDMTDQVRTICKTMGMTCVRNERLGSALYWAIRSKDVAFVANLAERFLMEYNESGDFSSLDILDHLGNSVTLSNNLAFLGKYREFHKMHKEGRFNDASAVLLSLLTSSVAPKKFWLTMLTDALPMLETDNVIFSTQQTYELLHCLEEINIDKELSKKNIKDKGDVQDEEVENIKLELLKTALARNLARAIIMEGSTAVM